MTDTFTTWRLAKLGRETSIEQRNLADALNSFLTQCAGGNVVTLAGHSASGQTTLICDWIQWALRSCDDVDVYFVTPAPRILHKLTSRGLLPLEVARLHVTDEFVGVQPNAIIIYDGVDATTNALKKLQAAS